MEATNDEQLLDIVMCNSVWLHRFLVKLKFYSSFAFFAHFTRYFWKKLHCYFTILIISFSAPWKI